MLKNDMNEKYQREIKVLDKGFVRYVDHMGSDTRIVEAARVSYGSPSQGEAKDRALLERLYRDRHTSPFEMVKLTLNLKMPIFVARQYVRHRMQNMNEFSARYKELPDEFYIPEKWRKQDTSQTKQGSVEADDFGPDGDGGIIRSADLCHWLENYCNSTFREYRFLLNCGVAREMARMVLPLNIYTEMYATWDLKNLLHFLTLREDPHAQWEHQQYGLAIKQILVDLFPWTIAAYKKYKFVVTVP